MDDSLGLGIAAIAQAVAAVLWPTQDRALRRLQRICLVLLLASALTFVAALTVAYLLHSWHALTLFIAAAILLIVSGILGNHIENRCKAADSAEA